MPPRAVNVLLVVAPAIQGASMDDPLELGRIAAKVNAAKLSWRADPEVVHHFPTLGHVQRLCGGWQKGHPKYRKSTAPEFNLTNVDLPADLDPRIKWPHCTVIGKVRNQAGCGSCWAFGSTESFEASRCIAGHGDVEYSADDTAFCSDAGDGCEGGNLANEWFVESGVVTGGEYGTQDGCLPYGCPPCTQGLYPPACPEQGCDSSGNTQCTRQCGSWYAKTYSSDKVRAQSAFSSRSVSNMQQALYSVGPLGCAFSVYSDFPTYSSGVYTVSGGQMLGGHIVVMQGWGTENGVDYWLIKNSWTDKWGDKGYFKIRRGTDEAGIEDDVGGTHHALALVQV